MSEEKSIKLHNEQLNAVASGDYARGSGGYTIYDEQGNVIGTFTTLEEAQFFASGFCPRCRKSFDSQADRLAHMKAWASGQK